MNAQEFDELMRKRRDVVERVDDFTRHFPNTENGPAHVVLSDYNMLDYYITRCRDEIAQLLNGKPSEYRQTQEELLATDAFLQGLMDIPEVERDFWGDEWSE